VRTRRAFFAVLALLPGLALAQGLKPTGKMARVGELLPHASPGVYKLLPGTLTSSITVSRSASTYCGTSNGSLVLLGANQACVETAGLRVEPATTNTALASISLTNGGGWGSGTDSGSNTISTNAGAAPDGTTTASLVAYVGMPPASYSYWGTTSVAATTSGTWTCSVYLKQGTIDKMDLLILTSAGLSPASHCTISTTQWNRCSVSQTHDGSSQIQFYVGSAGGSYGTHGAGTIYEWGAQCEPQPFATSYVPTTVASATRDADAALATGVKYGPVSGSVQWTYTPWGSGTIDTSNFALVGTRGPGFTAPGFNAAFGGAGAVGVYSDDGTGQVSLSISGFPTVVGGVARTFKYAWFGASTYFYVDGSLWNWGATKSPVGHTRLWLLTREDSYGVFNGHGWIQNVTVAKSFALPAKTVSLGDSITEGSLVTTPYPVKVQRTKNFPTVNAGVSGNTTTQILARWESTYRGQGYRYVTIMGGINDTAGTEAATIANVVQLATEALAEGAQVRIMEVTPRSAQAAQIATINAGLVTYAASAPAGVRLLDTFTPLNNGGALAAAYDSGDGRHPNQAGTDIIAGILNASLP
jgi:lysophospholipase L1-like esterase